MLTPNTHRQIVMAERPSGPLAMRHFRSEVVPVPPRPADAVLLRNIFVSVAPGARAVMQGAAYRRQLVPGEVIPSSVIAEVMTAPPGGPEPGGIVGGEGLAGVLGRTHVRDLAVGGNNVGQLAVRLAPDPPGWRAGLIDDRMI
ncbi:hypothetical protein [Micromonospora sp. NPDC005367]|uniref:hypothetical protein n=1 Tax=Micromonospora sp. NPDC005367 TaxID=3155590 RepID=UPI0033B5B0AB